MFHQIPGRFRADVARGLAVQAGIGVLLLLFATAHSACADQHIV